MEVEESIRLQKFLANSGVASRRKCEELILDGKVSVNGQIVKELGTKVNPAVDKVEYCGNPVFSSNKFVYILLNKPIGYVTTAKDQFDRDSVLDLVKVKERVVPVGRLDMYTSGALILTNDGDFAHKLLAPSRHHSKLYYACVEGIMDENDILKFKEGITIDHYRCQSSNLSIIKTEDNTSEVLIEIFEGKFHQVKKMVESVGKKVTYLKRLQMKNLKLDTSLQIGKFRELSEDELVDLMNDL